MERAAWGAKGGALRMNSDQCFRFRRTIGLVTPKNIFFSLSIKYFLDQKYQKYPKNILHNFEKGSTDSDAAHLRIANRSSLLRERVRNPSME